MSPLPLRNTVFALKLQVHKRHVVSMVLFVRAGRVGKSLLPGLAIQPV